MGGDVALGEAAAAYADLLEVRAEHLRCLPSLRPEPYPCVTIGHGTRPLEEFVALLRDLVARGRAAGIPVVAATQRPSFDIIPTSLRDLFGYRAAFRCTTPNSSNIVLGHGWAEQGHSATDISPTNQGAAYLIAEGGVPRRIKVAYLSDADITAIADYAAWIRRPDRLNTPAASAA